MEHFIQKRMREQRRHIPSLERQSETARYYDCAIKPAEPNGPSLQSVRHNAAKCWEGYERVPGTKPYADGSCRKKGSGKKKKSKDKAAKKDGDKSSSSSSSDDEDSKPKKQKKEKKKKEGDKGGSS